ncbi:unnamed protein product [Rhizophagus irregularis]|nr:unnamed protein product [Rhizophagus irregularis]
MQEVVQGTVSSFGTVIIGNRETGIWTWNSFAKGSVFGLLPLECDLDGLNDFDFRRDAFLRGHIFLVLGLQVRLLDT